MAREKGRQQRGFLRSLRKWVNFESAWWRTQSRTNRSPQQNSLLTGKNTGNFSVSTRFGRFDRRFGAENQRLTEEFPTDQNREFDRSLQGIARPEQGLIGK